MTAAGLVSFAYADAALDESKLARHRSRKSRTVQRGLEAFHRFWKAGHHEDFYYLWSVERVGTVVGLPDLKWYEEGARYLVGKQSDAGSWATSGGKPVNQLRPLYHTCLALLFLSRASLPARKGVTTPSDESAPATPSRFPDLIDPSRGRGQRLERAFTLYTHYADRRRSAVAPLFGAAGPRVVRFLIARLDDDREESREAAYDLFTRLVKEEIAFVPRWSEHRRRPMLKPFERFWSENGADLRWDAAKRRFVVPDR